MNWKTLTACVGLSVIASATSAQMYRCKDSAGKTTYTDSPCSGTESGQQIQRAKTREEILEDRLRIAEDNERNANIRAQRAERASTSTSMESRERTMNINYRDHTPDKSKSSECISAKKELAFVSSIQTLSRDDKRARMSAADTNVRVSCQ